MKLLRDYTEKELIALQEDEKAQLYLLELADRGITLPSATPAFIASPEKRADLAPDLAVYKIGKEYGSGNFYFRDEETAKKILEMINAHALHLDYQYRSSGPNIYYCSDAPEKHEIKVEMVYSAAKYSEFKTEIDAYEASKSRIDSNNSRRESIISKQEAVIREIEDAISAADRNITKLNGFKALLEEYRKMANGDEDIAIKFLLNANYSDIVEYDDEQLTDIGLSREIITKFNNDSLKED